MNQQLKVNIPIGQLKQRTCPCGGIVFVQAVSLKEVPPVYSPSGNPETMIQPLGFICSQCGNLLSLRPEEPEEGNRIIT